ncbi:YceD family protein [Parafrigoribacterium humi]|uniref:YceD family protein n=1 Tax=Parafrigoribacterium humi TaxID=3144664 RepID=UPI0032EAD353
MYDLLHRPGEMRERTLSVTVPDDLGTEIIAVKAGSVLTAELRLESLHDGILVSADVSGAASGECVRCLIGLEQPVEVEIQELFAYSEDEAFDYAVQVDTIDLEPVIRDAVVLSLPFQPVCQDDCLGLCPECGVRLLDNPGHEHEAPVDPRWAALAGLEGLGGEGSTQEEDVAGTGTGTTEEKR